MATWDELRSGVSRFVSQRSVLRHHQYPTLRNTWHALLLILVSAPFIPIVFLLLIGRRSRVGQGKFMVLAVENEFGLFVDMMEYLRARSYRGEEFDLVLVLSKRRHSTLETLYCQAIGCRMVWSTRFSKVFQQAILLQPSSLVSFERLKSVRFYDSSPLPFAIPETSAAVFKGTLKSLGLVDRPFVAMAVYTRRYDEQNNPQYLEKQRALETHGDDLVPGIKYLQSQNIAAILVGAKDTDKSRVPLSIPRLSDFGDLGGHAEVALASNCTYLWNDFDVGAWWLAVPFKRPVLTTNRPRPRLVESFTENQRLYVPVRYQRPDGSELSLREMLEMKLQPHKAAAIGDLLLIRNTPQEIVAANAEMLARVRGIWRDNSEMLDLQDRCRQVFLKYSDGYPMPIASSFLVRHPDLVRQT
jgi:putative glycosyltransferase (TIGR04372 family)